MHINIILVKQNHKLFINKKFNNFCISGNWNKYGVKEDNSITVGKHVLCHHWPNYIKTPLVRSCSALGQQHFICWNFSVGPLLG